VNFRTQDPPTIYQKFPVGTRVLYIPYHAHGDEHHPDCEIGIVSSLAAPGGADTIWVKFDSLRRRDWDFNPNGEVTAQGCRRDQLIRRDEYERRRSLKR